MNRYLPYALVAMSVVFSIFGMIDEDLHVAKIAALAILHGLFVKLLSGTLDDIIREWKINRPKAVTLVVIGSAYATFDVWLVHYGLAFMLDGWHETLVWPASIAFTAINIFAHWVHTPTKEQEQSSSLGENVHSINDRMTGT